MKNFLQIVFILPLPFLYAGIEERKFYEAVRAEASGDLDSAIKHYKSIANSHHSANLHANLANLYFKTKNYGKSILHYRKALLIEPANREFKENLKFTLEIAGVPKQYISSEKFLSFGSANLYLSVSVFLFWIGTFLFAWIFILGWDIKKFLVPLIVWITFTAITAWAFIDAENQNNLLEKEVIVVSVQERDSNSTSLIPLRKFAGNGSSENAFVKPGESLWLQFGNDQKVKSHTGSKGEKWFLVHSLDSIKKGWIKYQEISPILPKIK